MFNFALESFKITYSCGTLTFFILKAMVLVYSFDSFEKIKIINDINRNKKNTFIFLFLILANNLGFNFFYHFNLKNNSGNKFLDLFLEL